MTHTNLTFIRFENGIWQSHIQAGQEPAVEVQYQGETLEEVTLTPAENGWDLSIHVPSSALSEGVHSFVITDGVHCRKTGRFHHYRRSARSGRSEDRSRAVACRTGHAETRVSPGLSQRRLSRSKANPYLFCQFPCIICVFKTDRARHGPQQHC